MKWFRRMSAGAAALVSLLAPAVAEAAPGIRGRVTDARSGVPILAAQVVARDAMGAIVAGTLTDSAGTYELWGVPAGVFTVEASRLGYDRAARGGVRVDGVGAAQVDISLNVVALQADAVLVTSTRRVERLADTDVSVAVVSGGRVETRGEPSVLGALRRVSGIDFFSAGVGQQQPNARGFVNPFTTNMLVLVDGRLAALPGFGTVLAGVMPTVQADIEQIEVVTGPSSALYGANAANGVISILTTDPRERRGGAMSATGGDHGQGQLGFRFSGLASPRLGYKVSAERFEGRDFERYNLFTGANGFVTRDDPDFNVLHETLAGSLFFYPGPGSRLVYSGGFTRANYINLTVAGRLQVSDWDAWYQQVRANFSDVLGGSLYMNASYTKNDAGRSYYLDVLTRMQIPQASGGAGLSPATAMQRALFVDRSDRVDFEAQHTVRRGDAHFLTSGAMVRRSRPVTDGTWMTDGPGGDPVVIEESGAYVGYDNLSIPRLRLTVVGRVDTHSDFSARYSPKLSASYSLPNGHSLRATYNEAFNSPNNYLLYARSNVGRDAFGFGNWIRGNRSGFTFVNTAGGPVPSPVKSLEPLHVSSVEVGYRASWGTSVSLDVTAYRSTYRNYISKEATLSRPRDSVFVLDPKTGTPLRENTRTYLNYGELPVNGVDISLEWIATSRWSAEGSFGYQQPGTFKRPVEGLAPPGFNAPARKAKAAVAFHEWWRAGTQAELSVVGVTRFDFLSSLPYLTGPVPEYAVADLQVTLPVVERLAGRTELRLGVKNLFDRSHIEVPGGAELRRLVSLTLSTTW